VPDELGSPARTPYPAFSLRRQVPRPVPPPQHLGFQRRRRAFPAPRGRGRTGSAKPETRERDPRRAASHLPQGWVFPSTITGMGYIRRLVQHYTPISEAGGAKFWYTTACATRSSPSRSATSCCPMR